MLNYSGCTNLPASLGGGKIGYIQLRDGRRIEPLFDESGQPVPSTPHLGAINTFFKKNFKPATFEGTACLVNA
ncbi:MAG: hypothetical protein EOP50_06235 [Sphingobacteriales bacterium]|nr:MAG: hypothetical protein EOP50_06235 [Sphingobacteriales bacterium]